MSEPTAAAVPAGWYPDQNGHQRWWDGTQWTENVQAPYDPATRTLALKAPDGTKTGTVWIWLINALLVVGMIPFFLVDWAAYVDSTMVGSITGDPTAQLGMYTTPGYVVSQLSGFVIYGLTVVFAALDVRVLKARGVQQPFHWAFAFLTSIVYVIGRSVVVKRRTGGGLAPLWVYIALNVLIFIVIIVWSVLLFQYMMTAFPVSTFR
jgi:hypothetical protein